MQPRPRLASKGCSSEPTSVKKHCEVLHRYVRLPREPGRLLRDRGGVEASWRSRRCSRGCGSHRRQLMFGDCQRRSRDAPDDQANRPQQSGRQGRRYGCYATRRPDELRELPNVVRIIANQDKEALVGLLEQGGELTTAERFA